MKAFSKLAITSSPNATLQPQSQFAMMDVQPESTAALGKSAFDVDSHKSSFDQLKDASKGNDKNAVMKSEYQWADTSIESASTWGSSLFTPQLAVPKFPALQPLDRKLSNLGPDPNAKFAAKAKRKTLLPPQRAQDKNKLTVILDLDETLIHSEFTGTNDYRQAELRERVSGRRPPDFSIVLYEGSTEQEEEIVHVYKRPGVEEFLNKLSEICEPVIFTAALPMYARPILKQIDPKRKCRSRLYRNATIRYRGIPHVKSLKAVGRDLNRLVLIDNSPVAMCADPDNAILCKAYYDDPHDKELDRLYEVVKQLVHMHDVRPFLQRTFNFHQVLNETMMQFQGL